MEKQVKIIQTRSAHGQLQNQIRTLQALGLRRIRHSVTHKQSPVLTGMLKVVAHLVKVEEAK